MAKRKKLHRLPVWIRNDEFQLLSDKQKNFLGYLYCFGPNTCWLWNWRLQKKFHRSRSTIQRWLRKLRELGFIWIEKPYGPQRMIHTRLLPTPEHWVQLIGTLALTKHFAKHERRKRARSGSQLGLHEHSSKDFIEQTKHDIINELVRRGETFKTAVKVADQVIIKAQKKRRDRGCQK